MKHEHVTKMYYRKVSQGPKGRWGMEISYSSSLPWGIEGVKFSASCMDTTSSADATKSCMEKTPCNYFMPIIRNGKQITWKEDKQ